MPRLSPQLIIPSPREIACGLHLPNKLFSFLMDWPLWEHSYCSESRFALLAIQICTSYKSESLLLSPVLAREMDQLEDMSLKQINDSIPGGFLLLCPCLCFIM